MSNPLLQAFFVGRALAEVTGEHLERSLTDALSELGKLDAEMREQLKQFTEEVIERANQQTASAGANSASAQTGNSASGTDDVQATIDELRAEIALLRTEMQRHRSSSV
ncbi:MAG: DUF6825 family protein [Mastigocoleus sp.]